MGVLSLCQGYPRGTHHILHLGFINPGGHCFQLIEECRRNGALREPFEQGWQVPPGRGCKYTSQDQGLVTYVGCAFDRIAARKPASAFSDRKVGLTKGFISKVCLILAYAWVSGYFLRGWQSCGGSSIASYYRCQRPLYQSVVGCGSIVRDGGRDCAEEV